MTYEYAVYFKLLLLCGYRDELQQYIDNALVEQDPLSEIILELSTAGSDDKRALSMLNEFLRQVVDSDSDWDKTVFELVMSFLKREYVHNEMSMKNITDLMYKLAVHTERYYYEPWYTMYLIGELFDEAETGYIDKADYQQKFEAFLSGNNCLCDYPPVLPKESFFKRFLNWMRGAH